MCAFSRAEMSKQIEQTRLYRTRATVLMFTSAVLRFLQRVSVDVEILAADGTDHLCKGGYGSSTTEVLLFPIWSCSLAILSILWRHPQTSNAGISGEVCARKGMADVASDSLVRLSTARTARSVADPHRQGVPRSGAADRADRRR